MGTLNQMGGTSVTTIARLEPVALRDLWKHEERGFSIWLHQNIQVLGEALGMRLTDPQREVTVGSFTVDLVAEEEDLGRVVIENQLEATDHDHLGKLLTYLTNLEAKTAVWITPKARPEHARTVAWLNETTPDDVSFYLVQVAAYRIAGSEPAPLLTVIAGPSPEGKGFGQQKKQLAERHLLRLKFWEGLLKRAKELDVQTHATRSPSKESWIQGASGRSGMNFNYVISMDDDARVELYIDTGNVDENKAIFDSLLRRKSEIEMAFGGPLEWERLDERRASRICCTLHNGGLSVGEASWPGVQEPMIDAMRRLVGALKPFVRGAGA
jgi:hypothetical protein